MTYDPNDPMNRTIQDDRRRDEAEGAVVGGKAWVGFVLGGIVGALAGLVVSFIPGLGIAWWAGLTIGFFVGITLGGFVVGRLALNDVDQETWSDATRTRPRPGGSRGFRPR